MSEVTMKCKTLQARLGFTPWERVRAAASILFLGHLRIYAHVNRWKPGTELVLSAREGVIIRGRKDGSVHVSQGVSLTWLAVNIVRGLPRFAWRRARVRCAMLRVAIARSFRVDAP